MSRISVKLMALYLLATAMLVAASELLLRSCAASRYGPKEPIVWELGDGATGAALNDVSRGLWSPRPGAKDPWGEVVGQLGCRGPDPSGDEGRLVVLALGDSSTYGYGLREAQAWPRLVEARLRERGLPVDVVNGGVIGYTVVQGRVRFEELAPLVRPRVAVLAFGAVNDHYAAPGGVSDRARVELWSRRNAWSDRLRRESALVQFAADMLGAADSREVDLALQKQREAWGALDYQGVRRVSLEDFAVELSELCGAVRALDAEPVLVSMPRRADFEARKPVLPRYTAAVGLVAKDAGVALVDARAALASWPASDAFLPNDRVHPTPEGHARIADLVADAVLVALDRR